jgi:hypothetical protein
VHPTLPSHSIVLSFLAPARFLRGLFYKRSAMQRAIYVVAPLTAVVLSVVSPVAFPAQRVPCPTPPIGNASSGLCLQPSNKSMEPGALLWKCAWLKEAQSSTLIEMRSLESRRLTPGVTICRCSLMAKCAKLSAQTP